jgi:hypothetical protein
VDGDTVAGLLSTRRAGAWLGAELHVPVRDWFFSVHAKTDYVRSPLAIHGWATGPVVKISRPPQPDRVVGVDPVLEAEVRFGDVEYQQARLRAGHTVGFGRARSAVLVGIATTSGDTPLDTQPSTDRDLAPWLPVGALRSRYQTVLGVDVAVPTIISGYARVRVRAIAAGDDLDLDLIDGDGWRFGGEIGAIWPTVLGPVAIGAAAGQRAKWRLNISLGTSF